MKRYKRDHLSSNDIAVNALIAQAMRQNKRFLLLNFNNKHILNLIKIIWNAESNFNSFQFMYIWNLLHKHCCTAKSKMIAWMTVSFICILFFAVSVYSLTHWESETRSLHQEVWDENIRRYDQTVECRYSSRVFWVYILHEELFVHLSFSWQAFKDKWLLRVKSLLYDV